MQTGRGQEILGTLTEIQHSEGQKSFRLLLDAQDGDERVSVAVVGRAKKRSKKSEEKMFDGWPLEVGASLLVSGYVREELHRVSTPYTIRAKAIVVG